MHDRVGFMHLTNVAIQKKNNDYDQRTGGKMELQALKMYLMSIHGHEKVDAIFWEMQMIILRYLFCYHWNDNMILVIIIIVVFIIVIALCMVDPCWQFSKL